MKRNHFSPARTAMKLLCLLLGLIFAGMLSLTLYVQHLTGQIPIRDGGIRQPSGGNSLSFLSGGIAASDGAVNFLLIGQDHREGETGNRSDTMILCTFHPSGEKLIMTSVLRDLYLPIPGHGSNRINAAYAIGGGRLLQQTMEDNFDIRIDGRIEVDFSQFSQIIDLLGGVDIHLRQDEAQLISEETGTNLNSGLQHLNGNQALSYSRIRKLDTDGDFSRTNRQRTVLEAIVSSYKSADLPTLLKTTANILPMITTDMNQGELLRHAISLFPRLSTCEIVSRRIPADGQYTDQTIDGMSVLVADMASVREFFRNLTDE